MIYELIQFTELIPDESISTLVSPQQGLHVSMQMETDEDGRIDLDELNAKIEYYDGKSEPSDFLLWCADRAALAWCINTNKCFDLPAKGLHSCSPYVLAMKRESLSGGAKFQKDKVKITDRFGRYFENALELVEEDAEKERLLLWRRFFEDEGRLVKYLEQVELYPKIKEKDYVIFYLEEERGKYKAMNDRYLSSRLFNTDAYNIPHPDNPEELLGTSDFHNGYNSKKPFLEHKTATFDINGRISSSAARSLYFFSNVMRYRIFPQPLPIFVNEAERVSLQQKFNRVSRLSYDGKNRPSHREVMEKLLKERGEEGIGNYYLLYHSQGEILDFDFVPKFEYALNDSEGNHWRIERLFLPKSPIRHIRNVFDFQDQILPDIFNNALVVQRKDKRPLYRWFDEIKKSSYVNDTTVYLVQTYRKAFYDFIYKSRRQALLFSTFDRIMRLSILDDIRLDEVADNKHTKGYVILNKMDIWFSLYDKFIGSPVKDMDMVNQTRTLRAFLGGLVEKDSDQFIETEAQYAFAAGQVIQYLFQKIRSDQQPHVRLEPFLRAKTNAQLKQQLVQLFDRYKHENFSGKFRRAFSQVMASDLEKMSPEFLPVLLAGYFSENLLRSSSSDNN